MELTREKAYQHDISFYADYDYKTESYGVFGTETGFCYSTHPDLYAAELEVNAMNKAKQTCNK